MVHNQRIQLIIGTALCLLLVAIDSGTTAFAEEHAERWAKLKLQGDDFERGEVGIAPERIKFDRVPTGKQSTALKELHKNASGAFEKRINSILKYKSSAEQTTRAKTAFEKALKLQNEKKWDEAIKLYDEVIEANPLLYESDYNAGLCYQKSDRPTQAIERYRSMIALRGEFSTAMRRLGESYHAIQDEKKAIQFLSVYYQY